MNMSTSFTNNLTFIELHTHPSFSLHYVSLATHSFSSNYQPIAEMAIDSLLQFHYTNGSPFYYMSFCDVHGHNRRSEIHLP